MGKIICILNGTCLKLIVLTTLLLLSGINMKAQSNGGNTKTYAKGDINEDGYVDAADVVALVEIIMKGEGTGNVDDEDPDSDPQVDVYIDEEQKKNMLAGIASTLCDFKRISNNVDKWYTGIEKNTEFEAPVSPSSQVLYNFWASPYTLIARSLTLQANAEESNLNSLLSLCDIIDALAYEELTTYFGDVPYRTKDDDPFSGIPKQSISVIITNLITRLSQTITYADDRKGGQISGTTGVDYFANPTSDLASLILAELYISNGNYQSALPLLAGIINSRRYSIEEIKTRSSLNSSDIIFSLTSFDAVETVFRTYTDVLLLKAECDYMTGNSSSAKQLTDYIISNKGIDVSETNIAKAIAAIRKILYEQTNGYYAYLKRSGLAKEILGLEDYQLLLPIPSNEIMFNPYITQNPGY